MNKKILEKHGRERKTDKELALDILEDIGDNETLESIIATLKVVFEHRRDAEWEEDLYNKKESGDENV